MSQIPVELKYSKEHEWVKISDSVLRVGITDYAQNALGDVVYIDFPKVDSQINKGAVAGTIESVKAVSEIYQPVSGKIAALNTDLGKNPAFVNTAPYDQGWLYEVSDFSQSDLDSLLTAAEYEEYLKTLG